MDLTVWVVGKFVGKSAEGAVAWELQGVFERESDAEAACVDYSDFIGPVKLNEALPRDRVDWPGARYPILQAP